MAALEVRPSGTFSPVAVVWCRQVDNEAESPGYTTIPEDFPGRRETLETIRLVGNLTVNVADTHDYWDPDPAQTLSYYPNLFLYPAGNGRYTCVGRMFLSTEDRPRLGMKTLVLDTAQIVAGGDFGGAVLQAWGTMGGRPSDKRRTEPDAAVYQAVGEGFLFHRGTTEPVVIVAGDQWESAIDAMTELLRMLPTSLIALGAFLAFPYFLPEGKVNLHEFAEQIPLALALMRVPEREAQGDRHAKRIQSWESAPVSLRDLTKPPPARGKDPLPLVLQYVRDHADEKILEVSRRVDLVEATRLRAHMEDSDHQGGKDRRKEMWRIGTGMESAALLLARPRGRQIPMTGEAAKRANQYLQAHPSTDSISVAVPAPPPLAAPAVSDPVAAAGANQVPPWLQRPPEVSVPGPGPVAVPVSVSDDPSTLPTGAVPPAPLAAPDASRAPPPPIPGIPMATASLSPEAENRLKAYVDQRFREIAAIIPPPADPKSFETRLAAASLDSEARSSANLDRRLREQAESQSRALTQLQADLSARLNTLEGRPVLPPSAIADAVGRFQRDTLDPKLAEQFEKSRLAINASADATAAQIRTEIADAIEEMRMRATRSEEELRVALIAQMDLEIREAKEQGSALREEIEGRMNVILKERLGEVDARRTKESRELEQRLALLVDGRVKDLETRTNATLGLQREALLKSALEQVGQAEKRLELADQAALTSLTDAQNAALAGLQVRLQSYFDQRMREDQEREREKYVELLARLKTEVDQGLAHTVDSADFDRAVQTRTLRTVEALHLADQKTLEQKVADASARLKAEQGSSIARLAQVEVQLKEREAAISSVEKSVRTDLEELDRRLQVMADRMVPLVRNTWLKVEDLQKGNTLSAEAEARMKEFRREFTRELRRIEGEMLEQTTELRDRMEGAIAHQGRIWLNFVRSMADAEDDDQNPADAAARSLRRVARAAASSPLPDPRVPPMRTRPTFQPFDEIRRDDPVNPLDPRPEPAETETPERRRARRAS
jgi:hypothetical protein